MSSGNGNGAAAAGGRRRVVVTGAAGRLGRLIARRLHRDPRFTVIGLDRRPFVGRPKDIDHDQVDLRSKKARDIFRQGGIDALVHLGVMHTPRATSAEHYSWNIGGTDRLLEYCLQYRVPKVVVLSSANVYGPRPENAQFLTEDAPLLAAQAFPEIRDLVEIDHMASSFFWKAREIETGDPAAGPHPRPGQATRRRTTCGCRSSRGCSASTPWSRSSTSTTWPRPSPAPCAPVCAASST